MGWRVKIEQDWKFNSVNILGFWNYESQNPVYINYFSYAKVRKALKWLRIHFEHTQKILMYAIC